MRRPNGGGTVYKLSGKRRKPFIARVTIGWTDYDRLTMKSIDRIPEGADPFEKLPDGRMRFCEKQLYKTIGTYETKLEALDALALYRQDPFDLQYSTMTLEELYERWSEQHYETVSHSNVVGCKASWKLCEPIKKMRLVDLKLDHFQMVFDNSGKNSPTLKKLKITLGLMYDYAVKHEILSQDKRAIIRYIDIKKAGNPNARNKNKFTKTEIKTLWKWKDASPYFSVILMLLYTGCRIGEFLDLKKENVNLQEKWFDVVASKTEAGVRKVPIHDKVLPFFQEWMTKNDCEYLISTPEGKHFAYRNYYDSYWKPLMNQLSFDHHPHETRHTFESLMVSAGVDDKIIRKIIGHKGLSVGEIVYMHWEVEQLIEAVNQIQV